MWLILRQNSKTSNGLLQRDIYGKLGVNNQMKAVEKARGLGLFEKD